MQRVHHCLVYFAWWSTLTLYTSTEDHVIVVQLLKCDNHSYLFSTTLWSNAKSVKCLNDQGVFPFFRNYLMQITALSAVLEDKTVFGGYSRNLLSRIYSFSTGSLYLEWCIMPALLSIHLHIIKLLVIWTIKASMYLAPIWNKYICNHTIADDNAQNMVTLKIGLLKSTKYEDKCHMLVVYKHLSKITPEP